MTTARDFLDIVPVLDALAVQAGDLPSTYMTCFRADDVEFILDSRDDAIAWGRFLGTYDERPMNDATGRLIHQARGHVAGHQVTASYTGEPS